MSTAASVPSWQTAVNAAPGSSQPRKAGTMRRCALDEIGRNSVSPCTIPRTIDWNRSTARRRVAVAILEAMSLGQEERSRLSPAVFRLPVEKIRDGYYSDAYFNYTKELLEADDHHPHVVMQVFQRKESILGGIDEAIAVLKQCSGYRGPDGKWVNGFK